MKYAKPPYFQSHSKDSDGMYSTKVYNTEQVLCEVKWCGEKTDEHTTTSKRGGTAELFQKSPEMLEALKSLTHLTCGIDSSNRKVIRVPLEKWDSIIELLKSLK